jgi:hypothetical protein
MRYAWGGTLILMLLAFLVGVDVPLPDVLNLGWLGVAFVAGAAAIVALTVRRRAWTEPRVGLHT